MIIKARSVRMMARECGLTEDLLEDEEQFKALCSFVWRVAQKERRFCANKVRGWYHDRNMGKSHILDLLKEEDVEYELM